MGILNRARQENNEKKTNYEKMIETEKFQELMSQKKTFIIPLTIFFLAFYFTLPILTSYTKVLHAKAIGDITWVWLFAVAQFIMTWTLVTIYMKKSATFDRLASEVIEEETKEVGGR